MTRINCVPPRELTDKHLGAEYRELPRVFGLVRRAVARGELPTDKRNPTRYTLGSGHVRFFYPRLGYLRKRYAEIVAECERRGRIVRFVDVDVSGIGPAWFGAWRPTAQARQINRQRIAARL